MVLSRVRGGGALHTQSSVSNGAKTVTFTTFCVSALRLCALWSILLRLTQCPNSKRCSTRGSLGSFFGSAFWWGGCHKCGSCRGGFWLHRRRGSHLCSVCWCGWICAFGVVGKPGALYLSCVFAVSCGACHVSHAVLWNLSHKAGVWREETPVTVNRGRR